MIGLQGVSGAIFDKTYSDDRQLVSQTGLNELPEWVQAGDLSVGFSQVGDLEFVVEDYISNVAKNFAENGFAFHAGLGGLVPGRHM
jgi:hypothetical protein